MVVWLAVSSRCKLLSEELLDAETVEVDSAVKRVRSCSVGCPSTGPVGGGAKVGIGVFDGGSVGISVDSGGDSGKVGTTGASLDEQPTQTQAIVRTDDKMPKAQGCFMLHYYFRHAVNALSTSGIRLLRFYY